MRSCSHECNGSHSTGALKALGGLVKTTLLDLSLGLGWGLESASVASSRLLMPLVQGTPLYGFWNLMYSMLLGVIAKLVVWNVQSAFLDK